MLCFLRNFFLCCLCMLSMQENKTYAHVMTWDVVSGALV
jgi:hypothetical protein